MDLMEAAEKGDATAVKTALNKYGAGMDNKKANDYRMALQRACQYGQTMVVQQLLQVRLKGGNKQIYCLPFGGGHFLLPCPVFKSVYKLESWV